MITISPSLLACDFLNIETELNHFKDFENIWFHLDIMDGHFVPNLTFGHPVVELITKKTNQKCDAHFMVTNPEFYAETMKNLNLHNFTFHYESFNCKQKSLEFILNIKNNFPSVGISIKPNTNVEVLSLDILKNINLVLIMSVEPGFGGQKFMPNCFDKIKYLHKIKQDYNLNFEIQVDGGVSDQNAQELISAGATNLVAGSYVFKEGPTTYKDKIASIQNFIKNNR